MTEKISPEAIIQAIKDRQVRMTPRWRYVLRMAAVGIGIAFVAVGLFYFGSLIEYFWRQAHYDVLPGFGPRGYAVLVRRFPWEQLAVVILAFGLMFFMVRKFAAGYRLPILLLVVILLGALAAGSFFLVNTPIHERLQKRAEGQRLPVLGPLYHRAGARLSDNVQIGTVTEVSPDSFVMSSIENMHQAQVVVLSDKTSLPPGWSPAVGQRVIVLGDSNGATLQALAVRPAPGHFERGIPPRPMPRPGEPFEF